MVDEKEAKKQRTSLLNYRYPNKCSHLEAVHRKTCLKLDRSVQISVADFIRNGVEHRIKHCQQLHVIVAQARQYFEHAAFFVVPVLPMATITSNKVMEHS